MVSDGSRIKFWSDAWCGTVSLKGTFLELCHITQDKEALVVDHMHLHNGSVHWQIISFKQYRIGNFSHSHRSWMFCILLMCKVMKRISCVRASQVEGFQG